MAPISHRSTIVATPLVRTRAARYKHAKAHTSGDIGGCIDMAGGSRTLFRAGGFLAAALLLGTSAALAQQPAPTSGPTNPPPPPNPIADSNSRGPLDTALMAVPSPQKKTHVLPATLETTQWGWYDNAQPPALRIHAGDTVVVETMMHSHNQVVPGATIEQIKKLRTDFPGRGPHTITGPIYVEEAEPGDILKIHFNKIVPRAYATNFNVPGMFGEFPKDFADGQVKYFYLDLDKMQMEFTPGIIIPLRPFPGTIGVARAEPGRYSTVPPGRFGGNMDIREMVVGTTLYLPVFVKGALLWTGDSHAGQGNGEVNLTAIETAFKEQNMTIEVLKKQDLGWPRIETPTHWLTIGYDQDLNKAFDLLQQETVKFLTEGGLSPAEAQRRMLYTWDCRISEVVDVLKGTFCFNAKHGAPAGPVLPTAETPQALVTYAKNADLNAAMDTASLAMIKLLQEKKGMTRLDAYGLASVAMDCRLGRPSGTDKEVACLVPKSLWVAAK
jgi:acetamidase/formamidase